MYTLLLVITAFGTPDNVVSTHFPVATAAECREDAKLLAAQSTPAIKVEASCHHE